MVILLSAIGGILLTALLHGELLSVLGAGFQYWIMQPVFFNMLQVGCGGQAAAGLDACRRQNKARLAVAALAGRPPPLLPCRYTPSAMPTTFPGAPRTWTPSTPTTTPRRWPPRRWPTRLAGALQTSSTGACRVARALTGCAAPLPAACRPQVRPSRTSKAFWEAMGKVQSHLTDAKKVAAYNQKKEQKMRVSVAGCRCVGTSIGPNSQSACHTVPSLLPHPPP